MIHLGDITKIRGCVAPVVDVMIGGSPCQDLSIAGKRAGFSGERLTWSKSTTVTASKSRHLKARGNPGGKEII